MSDWQTDLPHFSSFLDQSPRSDIEAGSCVGPFPKKKNTSGPTNTKRKEKSVKISLTSMLRIPRIPPQPCRCDEVINRMRCILFSTKSSWRMSATLARDSRREWSEKRLGRRKNSQSAIIYERRTNTPIIQNHIHTIMQIQNDKVVRKFKNKGSDRKISLNGLPLAKR